MTDKEKKPTLVYPDFLSARYTLQRELGQGAYGIVSAAKDKVTGQDVAIKKVHNVFQKPILAKRALREIKLLRHFAGHENITSILDMEMSDFNSFNEIYISQELMEADLHQIIRSEQPLSDAHYQYFIYQICRGLKYIHSANVLHRDLKPGNLLVNADCELKICDFGLARGLTDSQDTGFMTEYVATRWYRAPEIMLAFRNYTKAIDMWSVGCILAELLGGKPLFKGRDCTGLAQMYIRSLPKMKTVPWRHLFPNGSPAALDLLHHLLQFDPELRFSVEQTLAHPYLESYHDSEDELFDFSFEVVDSIDEMKAMIAQEVMDFKKKLRDGGDSAQLPSVPKPNAPSPTDGYRERDDHDEPMAMDIDEELRQKGHH
ncbi:Mitogen-activated protein kinase [Kappamyces sp. JEL0680]|nr:Mitogen-activated protein kinase [Kappamyces sp. JEL0680]